MAAENTTLDQHLAETLKDIPEANTPEMKDPANRQWLKDELLIEMQKKIMAVVIDTMYALTPDGKDFTYNPHEVDDQGFRPYRTDELLRLMGANETALTFLEGAVLDLVRSGILSREESTPGKLKFRFNADVWMKFASKAENRGGQ